MSLIDLHVHTTFSDGTSTPTEAVELAASTGLSAIAITDHDNAVGYAEAKAAGERLGIEVVPGIEISARHDHTSIHILGYYIDPDSPVTAAVLSRVLQERRRRNEEICRLMRADGIDISNEVMLRRFGTSVGKPHFAGVLVENGLADSISEAFERYLKVGRKYHVHKNAISLKEAVDTIRLIGGIPVLAHPFQYKKSDAELREILRYGMELGLRGMECRYSLYDSEQTYYLEKLADEFGLVKTGGSDFHGTNKPHIRLGTGTEANTLAVPYEWLEILKSNGRNT